MEILNFLKPAEFAPPILDQGMVRKKYNYWRWRTLVGMYIGYTFFYFSRNNLSAILPVMGVSLGFNTAQLGLFSTIMFFTYGLSKFVSGILSDRSNPRYIMGVGLIVTGVLNILFGASNTFLIFALIWGLNGFFQGWGWPPCAKLLTHWYSQSERGKWWSLWNTSHNIGGAVIPYVTAIIVKGLGWRYGMYIPGVTCFVIGFYVIQRLRDTPQSLGLPPIEVYRNDLLEKGTVDTNKEVLSAKTLLVDYVLKNRYAWILSISNFFVYGIRMAVSCWGIYFLNQVKGYSLIAASSTIFWFEMGGFFGSLAAGWSSDYFFKGKRNPVNALFSFFVTITLLAMWKSPLISLPLYSFYIFWVGFFIFGPQMLIGVTISELTHKKAAATATGFAGCFGYAGSMLVGYPLGRVIQIYGWETFFIVLTFFGIGAMLLLFPIWKVVKAKSPVSIES